MGLNESKEERKVIKSREISSMVAFRSLLVHGCEFVCSLMINCTFATFTNICEVFGSMSVSIVTLQFAGLWYTIFAFKSQTQRLLVCSSSLLIVLINNIK